jgi:hypothetical protein
MGYKGGNPKNPCNQCWKKYAKPFSGPLVYSYSASSSPASNLQKPLPHNLPSAPSVASSCSAASSSPQPARTLTRNNPRQGGFNQSQNLPRQPMPSVSAIAPPPAGNSVTYFAGDPRIGGTVCWQCGGRGTFELLIFRETCSECAGIGRIFCMSFFGLFFFFLKKRSNRSIHRINKL